MDTSNSSAFDISRPNDLGAVFESVSSEFQRLEIDVEYTTGSDADLLIRVTVLELYGHGHFHQYYSFQSASDTCFVDHLNMRQIFFHQQGLVILLQQIERLCLVQADRVPYDAESLRALAHRFFLTHVKLQSEMYAQVA
jgi:hypothetical protein